MHGMGPTTGEMATSAKQALTRQSSFMHVAHTASKLHCIVQKPGPAAAHSPKFTGLTGLTGIHT